MKIISRAKEGQGTDKIEARSKGLPTAPVDTGEPGGIDFEESAVGASPAEGSSTLKGGKEKADGDSMWKTMMMGNFDEMLESVLPELAVEVDSSRRPEFLDKEMKDLKALMGGAWQAPDLLAKVPLKGGRDVWLALHVEVQGKGGGDFPERMFYYHSMIRFRYLKRKEFDEKLPGTKSRRGVVDVVSLAILTALRPKGEAEYFEHASFGNELKYVYPVVKLWELDADRLEKSHNPFDLALLAAKRMIDSGRSDNKRVAFLKQLGRLLDERGWSRERCLVIYRFIEWILRPRDEAKYEEYRNWLYKGERKMYVSIAEEVGMEKGLRKGKKIGLEKGKEIGKEIGREIGREIGKGEGILIGKEEQKRDTALRMLRSGMATSEVAELVDLPEEEVLRLAKEAAN